MKRAILAPAELGGAALSELKHWLAIQTTHEDEALVRLIRAALDICEAFTGVMPLAATCEEVIAATPDWQTLATRPVHAITGVEGILSDGARLVLPVDAYEVDISPDGSGLVRVNRPGAAGRMAVRFAAGLAPGWGSLPDGLRQGIIRLATHQYRERDDGGAAQPPAAVTALWRPWRRMRII